MICPHAVRPFGPGCGQRARKVARRALPARRLQAFASPITNAQTGNSFSNSCASPTWWSWRGGCTRSHSELGRETPQRRWYFVSRRGRVGRCQVCKTHETSLLITNKPQDAARHAKRRASRAAFVFPGQKPDAGSAGMVTRGGAAR